MSDAMASGSDRAFETEDLDELKCGVWLADGDGSLRFASSWLLEEVFRQDLDAAAGSGWIEKIERDDPRTAERWRRNFRSGEEWESELRTLDDRGRRRTVLVRASAVRLGDGRLDCWLGLGIDITERISRRQRQLREAREGARRAEREKIAREIHAGIQQLLYATKTHVAVLRRSHGARETRERSETIRRLIEEAIQVSRNLTLDLKPPVEDGLGAALSWLSEWMSDKHGLELEVPSNLDVELAAETALIAFDVLRELAFNVVKHAGVGSARVEVRLAGGTLECEIADSGEGFDPDTLAAGTPGKTSFGLNDIRGRLEAMGGSLSVESSPGKGTKVRFALPVRPEDGRQR